MLIGAHVSIQGGLHEGAVRAAASKCECFQIFSRNQRQWIAPPLTDEQIRSYRKAWTRNGRLPVLIHDSYLNNISTPDDNLRAKSCNALVEELKRAEALGVRWIVIHPGSHRGAGEKTGLAHCAKSLKWIFKQTSRLKSGILLETTAGQGNGIGHKLEHLAFLLENAGNKKRLAICADTCHLFAAGYDLKSKRGADAFWNEFDSLIGLARLKAFHINDSIGELGSHLDRHTFIGEGQIGKTAFRRLLRDERFLRLPGIMEIPRWDEELTRTVADIKKLRGKV